ncbi:unnamed protein product [Rotaria sp. Silwood1]|nr:unnamed protein product [Rotaria sp. Silwood1]CAF3610132.1 unnamed protein product [Rotaria sp. Silwood1]CAF4557519.1 unnamed protein product [Rotaria sp. Silwood1]CAF4847552.1 unnamed protein product [Rotaria sp. Silwood1]CAF4987054.1 unnamed protein product [Rotaria sp. Silwood1]
MSKPPNSSVAFWEDSRTYQTGWSRPEPITTIDKVNLTNFTFVITACCRNVENHLIGFQKNIRAIGALFRSYHLYLGESDSDDGTLKFLQEWSKNDSNHVSVYTAGQQRRRLFFRTSRLAHCRNYLFQRARTDMPWFDYYFVLDVDVTSTETFSVNNFLTNFIYPLSSWAVMTASQTDSYYDAWALRSWPTITYDFWERARQGSFFSLAWKSQIRRAVVIHNKAIPRNHSLIEVQSAFGGAAIYAAQYLTKDCMYNGWMDKRWWFSREQCEHVSFNECVRRNAGGGKFFINPQFQNV